MRAADLESARGVDKILCVFIEQFARNTRFDDVFLYISSEFLAGNALAVLRGNDDRLHPLHFAVFVFNRNLTFSVGTKIRQQTALSHFGEFSREFMRKRESHGHIFFRFVRGVTEHHSLIARAEPIGFVAGFSVFERIIDSESDIRALIVNGGEHRASIAIESVFRSVVTYFADCISCNLLNIDVAMRGYFTHYENKPRGCGSFAGNSCHRIFF